MVEIHYQAFANSGSLTLWLDDAQKQSLTFIDNDTRTLTDVRLGVQGIENGTRGTLYFDDFESRRFSYIGTLTDPGVDDPQATNPAGWFGRTYQYSATIPHAVSSVTSEQSSVDSYEYDLNGNMICRVEGGITFKQDYNAENRISAIHKMNGTCSAGTVTESWLYGYDGGGVRVSAAHYTGVTLDSLTLYYMGGAYEVTGSAVKKYYSMAGQTIMRDSDGSLKYLLTDHLGSTSAVVDQNGTLLSQQRYLPFGEVRSIPNSPVTQTDFGYTGQRNLSGTGLMDYKARMYSVTLGRFIQPDNIIPNLTSPQTLNRFGYVLNNPIRYVDPTGHEPKGPGSCYESKAGVCVDTSGNPSSPLSLNEQLRNLNISTDEDMPEEYKKAMLRAVLDIGIALAEPGENAWDAYQETFPTKSIVYDPNCTDCRNVTACGNQMSGTVVYNGAVTHDTDEIVIAALSSYYPDARVKNIVHEFGHVLNNLRGGAPATTMPSDFVDKRSLILRPNPGYLLWQQNTTSSGYETFADMFVAQVYGVWNTNIDPANPNIVPTAQAWMNDWIP